MLHIEISLIQLIEYMWIEVAWFDVYVETAAQEDTALSAHTGLLLDIATISLET